MDVISRVAVEIARQAIPGEIHQARLVAENFAKGGKRRKELLQPAKAGELGGFGVGDASLLAWIFHALVEAAPILAGFLASKALDNSSLIMREIHSALDARKSPQQNQVQSSQQQDAHSAPSSPSQDQFYTGPRQLQQCVTAMGKALQKAGLSSEESEKVAYQTIGVLWEDTPDALVFLRRMTERR